MELSNAQGGDLADGSSTGDLQRILECPTCLSVPTPPIYNCAKGHFICGKCRPKMVTCGLCRSDITDSRCFVAEKIVETLNRVCEYRAQGCKAVLAGSDFQKHVEEICDFRPVQCFFGGCTGSVVDFQDYVKHLSELHKARILKMDAEGTVSTNLTLLEFSAKRSDPTPAEATMPCVLEGIEGQTFVIRNFLRDDFLHYSLCIADSEAEAGKYQARVQLKRPGGTTEDPLLTTIMPVLSIRRSEDEIVECFHGIIHKRALLNVAEMVELSGGKKSRLEIEYQILKNQ